MREIQAAGEGAEHLGAVSMRIDASVGEHVDYLNMRKDSFAKKSMIPAFSPIPAFAPPLLRLLDRRRGGRSVRETRDESVFMLRLVQ
jgi:hypothetical protein